MIAVYPVIAAPNATAGDTKVSFARAKIFLLIPFCELVTMVGIVNSVEYLNSAEKNKRRTSHRISQKKHRKFYINLWLRKHNFLNMNVNCQLPDFCTRPETHDNLAQPDRIVNTIFRSPGSNSGRISIIVCELRAESPFVAALNDFQQDRIYAFLPFDFKRILIRYPVSIARILAGHLAVEPASV